MELYTQKLANYSIGDDQVYSLVPEVVKPYGYKAVIIGGKTAIEKAKDSIMKGIAGSDIEIIDTIIYGKECTKKAGAALAELPSVKEAHMIFAVGGGKAIDTVKVVNGILHTPYFTFPTIASTCAAYTEIAAVYNENHEFVEAYYCGTSAMHVFINTRIIVEAPEKYIWAGMGDTVAKYYESNLSARGRDVDYNVASGCLYSAQCVNPLLQYGAEAYEAAKKKTITDAFTQVVLSVIVGTGTAAVLLPEDYNSSIGHAICYGLTTKPEVEATALHGEMVAYGILVLLTVDGQYEELQKMLTLYKSIGLPCKLEHFNLTFDDLDSVLEKAVSTNDVVVCPYKVTKEILLKGMKELEALP